MTSIAWASAASGTWSVGANWTGGTAPGAGDSVVIDALSAYPYETYVVSLTAAVSVASLTIDSRNAELFAASSLSAGTIVLDAGYLDTVAALNATVTVGGGSLTLDTGASFSGSLTETGGLVALNGATLAGNVTWLGGKLSMKGATIFQNVTWSGLLAPSGSGSLTVTRGLTLLGAGGTGRGQATLSALTLDQVKHLNNASISLTGRNTTLRIENSPTLIFGHGLTVSNAAIVIALGDTLTNNGTLIGTGHNDGVSGGSFVNNGLIEGDFTVKATRFTNNGTIEVGAGNTLSWQIAHGLAAGAQSAIKLAGGDLVLDGFLSTGLLDYIYGADHISGGATSGFAVDGTLDNDGLSLTIGAGSSFGTLAAGVAMTIVGGTIEDLGGAEAAALTLDDLDYDEASSAATFVNATLQTVAFSGAPVIDAQSLTLDQSTLTGVGTLNIGSSLDLEGANITGVNGSGSVTVDFSAALYDTYLTIGATQSVAGYAFNFGAAGSFSAGQVAFSGGNAIDDASFTFQGGFGNSIADLSDAAAVTLGAHVSTTLLAGDLTLEGEGPDGAIVNAGSMTIDGGLFVSPQYGATSETVFDNSGLIALGAGSALVINPLYGQMINTGTVTIAGGSLEASATDLVNHGKLSVSHGTLILDGPLGLADLNRFAHPASQLIVNGNLDLGGGTVLYGSSALQDFTLTGTVSDGTLAIAAGSVLNAEPFGDSFSETFAAAVANSGTIAVTAGTAADGATTEFTQAISGTGTIQLVSPPGPYSDFIAVKLDGAVGAGQTLAFISGYDSVEFGSQAAAESFAGVISGLDGPGAIEPSFMIDNATIASATVSGSAIDISFAGGGSAVLDADHTLEGSVSFYNSGGNGILEYNQPGGTAHFPPSHF